MTGLEQTRENFSEQVPAGGVNPRDFGNIPPTVVEINYLWATYLAESMACCFQKHIVATTKDPAYLGVMQSALELSSKHIELIETIFQSIQHPLPQAFGEKDVDLTAPKLHDETFGVLYTKITSKYIFQNYYLAFAESTRPDIRQLFSGFIDGSRDIIQKADDVLLAKGALPKAPYIVVPNRVESVHDKDYFGSLLGDGRPLNAFEISNIFAISEFKVAIRALKIAFAQVAKSDEIREYFTKGVKLAEKHINVLRGILEKEGVPGPEIVDYRVTDSTESPFSDRLMLFHTTTVLAHILSAYGTGLSRITRKDLIATYTKLMVDILAMSKDGADLLIKYGWLEKVPETVDRKKLMH
ncbi:hypothetical protein CEB3_c20090 [Peptococcaceae bacterium CEB3]|nr:hypothetical protein CEB3_c20090 [Peptococcaceae bacterium CEB3]